MLGPRSPSRSRTVPRCGWEGLSEFDAAADNEVMEVVTYEEVPDVKGRDVRRVVGLRKFRSSAPETT
jgi:hypothetical protein